MRQNNNLNVLWLSLSGLAVVLLIAWAVVEFTGTRSFMGRLHSKHADTWYTHDQRRLTTKVDSEGQTTTEWVGSDETTANIKYVLDFYSDGKTRSVSAGSFSARIGLLHAEQMAMQRLMAAHQVPAHYTYTQVGQEYLVDVRGWLIDGAIRDITLLSLVPGEKP